MNVNLERIAASLEKREDVVEPLSFSSAIHYSARLEKYSFAISPKGSQLAGLELLMTLT